MKRNLTWMLLVLAWSALITAQAQPSVFDLVGRWEATIEFGKVKFKLAINVAKVGEASIVAKADIPEQGARGVPVDAMLFNAPAVRWEIDQFRTAFNGELNSSGSEIAGTFEEGPGGKPISVVFKRADPSTATEPERVYTLAAGEPPDIRGYWAGSLESPPGTISRLGLKIGRALDGTFGAALDLLDQGALDLPAASVLYTNSTAQLEWPLFQIVFEAKLDDSGALLAGDWKQRNRPVPVRFRRLDQPATVLPPNISFSPQKGAPEDIRGHWQGVLNVPGNKLRLIVNIGQTPESSYAGSIRSLDQPGGEIPFTSLGYTNPVVRIEWKGIRGVFRGKLAEDGTTMDGTWEQGGQPLDLKLTRAAPSEEPPSR